MHGALQTTSDVKAARLPRCQRLNAIIDANITAEEAYLITKGPKSSKALGKLPSEFYKK